MKNNFAFSFVILAMISICVLGCNSGSKLDGLSPCEGVVKIDGQSVSEAMVIFQPVDTSLRSASGRTDASGAFKMSTLNPGDGVMPGEYLVSVTKLVPDGPAPQAVTNEDGDDVTPPQPMKNELPEKYAKTTTSDLKVVIPAAGDKNLNIELKNN